MNIFNRSSEGKAKKSCWFAYGQGVICSPFTWDKTNFNCPSALKVSASFTRNISPVWTINHIWPPTTHIQVEAYFSLSSGATKEKFLGYDTAFEILNPVSLQQPGRKVPNCRITFDAPSKSKCFIFQKDY